ncbi:helix-turn-helix domain-containing protein [Bacteroides sp. CG01]|uniref:helix-turn-helix domain-containing protein n=1 Tax=Bacteroides sp. CG01 TaxID=3096000 RepID=UPI002AFEF850|nr:helix-turn-helix domain-containing protein [Bacteroides sp. CG01]
MEKILPKIDITEDFVIGNNADIDNSILSLYTQYPCRLKAEIFVLCMGGSLEATINLTDYTIRENDFITLSPGSIIQINKIEGKLKLYFMVFSSKFIEGISKTKSIIDLIYITKNHPILSLPKEFACIYEEFFTLMMKIYYKEHSPYNPEILKCMLLSILYRLSDMYHERPIRSETALSRSEEICKTFSHLVIQHYTTERNILYYAKQMNITPTHLSNTVKHVTGKTVMDIISEVVIVDAKAQLKSTNIPIHEISDSLNFPNVSFFGKYFKRLTGMSPQQYRNSDK